MTKERLEELIKQEARVYTPTSTIRLHKDDRVCSDKEILGIKQGFYLVHRNMWFPLNRVYETKEQVEWRNKTYTERTERFEPPMWEDLSYGWWTFDFIAKEGDFVNHYVFRISKLISISIVNETDTQKIFTSDPTKENYEKACEIVRDLFKGDK